MSLIKGASKFGTGALAALGLASTGIQLYTALRSNKRSGDEAKFQDWKRRREFGNDYIDFKRGGSTQTPLLNTIQRGAPTR